MAVAKKKAKRNAPVLSEKDAWRAVLQIASSIRNTSGPSSLVANKTKALKLMEIASDMLDQLASGVHRNPPLTVLSLMNPPKGGKLMSDQLYEIRYKHKGNGKDYYHDFKRGTQMLAMPDGSICIRRPGAKVWGDYPTE